MDADSFRNLDDEAGAVTWEARFIDTATAAGDDLRVVIDGYDDGRNFFGPVIWTPHPGPVYPQAGDTALVTQSDSGRWWVLEWGAAATPIITAPPAYVTSLPGSPVDGQEVYYAADAANGVIWHLRYRSASPSAYKWEFIGGSPFRSITGTAQTFTLSATPFTRTTLTVPTRTLPLAGDYLVQFQCSGSMTTATPCGDVRCEPCLGGVSLQKNIISTALKAQFDFANWSAVCEILGATAGQVVDLRMQASVASVGLDVRDRELLVTPARVS